MEEIALAEAMLIIESFAENNGSELETKKKL